MSAEENKTIHRRLYEASSAGGGNEEVVDGLVSPDFVGHAPPYPDVHDPENLKEFNARTLTILPDARYEIEDMLAEGDKVAVRWTPSGTHQGESRQGIAPTGKGVSMTGISIARFDGGKLAEAWYVFDLMGMMQQMGALPTPEQRAEA